MGASAPQNNLPLAWRCGPDWYEGPSASRYPLLKFEHWNLGALCFDILHGLIKGRTLP